MPYRALLAEVISQSVDPLTVRTDSQALFPRENIEALGAAGLLGLVSAKSVGGMGLGLLDAAEVVKRLAQSCGSTAMIMCMHYVAAKVIEQFGDAAARKTATTASGLTTLAFSEEGSRSHFWAPSSTARAEKDAVVIDARKSWVTSAFEAATYVWSSRPLAAEGASTIWLVDAKAEGLSQPGRFDGMGLRGNASTPILAQGVRIAPQAQLGEDGKGFDIMMGVVLPWFVVLNAACSLGLMEGVFVRAIDHVRQTRHVHLDASLADLPTIRASLAKARLKTDMVKTLLDDTMAAIATGRADTMTRVLEIKAAAAEAALEVTDIAMRVCGGAAFRKDLGIERLFRDARAAAVMAPTSDLLYDFIGKSMTGLPLF